MTDFLIKTVCPISHSIGLFPIDCVFIEKDKQLLKCDFLTCILNSKTKTTIYKCKHKESIMQNVLNNKPKIETSIELPEPKHQVGYTVQEVNSIIKKFKVSKKKYWEMWRKQTGYYGSINKYLFSKDSLLLMLNYCLKEKT